MKKFIAIAFVTFSLLGTIAPAAACFISSPADCNPACDQYKHGWC